MKEVNTDLIERTMVGAIRKVNSWDGTNAPLRWLLYDLTDEWSERLKDMIYINDDIVTHIEPELNLVKRFVIIEYFGEFLPVYALAYVVKQIKGKL